MVRRRLSASRAVAILLLSALLLGAVGAGASSCCAGAEPCCAVLPAGAACASCASTPALAAPMPLAGNPPAAAAIAAFLPRPLSRDNRRPWRPPD